MYINSDPKYDRVSRRVKAYLKLCVHALSFNNFVQILYEMENSSKLYIYIYGNNEFNSIDTIYQLIYILG